ncbi:MAG: 23S rRNA (uracil(1939)-C(5))-methyltransferase RlmD [Lachnospiraceae bacterium]|nr:23S rRNA (uracil(1939)-C(5))-methyltransferase RlmD [Lachnospiraceae bacterium]
MKEFAGCALKKNDLFELHIDALGNEGEGIGRFDGFTFFVKDAVPGDVIRARVLKLKKNYGYARVEQLLTLSPDRVTPRCPVAGPCGGCQLQHLSYEKQLEYKQNKLRDCLERIGGVAGARLEPIIGMDEPYFYRNKAQFPVGRGRDGKPAIGFYAGHTHSIIETERCYIQAPVNEALVAAVREYLTECGVQPYDESTHSGLIRHVLTRVGFATGEIMVCMVINGTSLPRAEVLQEKLERAVERWNGEHAGTTGENAIAEVDGKMASAVQYRLASLCLNINTEKTNRILGSRVVPLYGEPYITDYIGPIQYRISPLSFYQVNPRQTRRLYELALAYADLKGSETVWDLYCGIGTISLFLAQRAKMVYGVEIVPQAIEDARKNAELNGITNAEFFVGAAEEVLPLQYEKSGGAMRADVVVVDPPRKGCDEALLRTIAAMQPERVVYVSCDPATLARDVKFLGQNGYEFVKGRGVDQFGMGGHVETVVLMSKVK